MSANNLFSEINVNYRISSVHLILNTIQPNDAFIANLFGLHSSIYFPPFLLHNISPHSIKMHFFMENLGLEFYFLMIFLWNGMVEHYFPLDIISPIIEICHRKGMMLSDIK